MIMAMVMLSNYSYGTIDKNADYNDKDYDNDDKDDKVVVVIKIYYC